MCQFGGREFADVNLFLHTKEIGIKSQSVIFSSFFVDSLVSARVVTTQLHIEGVLLLRRYTKICAGVVKRIVVDMVRLSFITALKTKDHTLHVKTLRSLLRWNPDHMNSIVASGELIPKSIPLEFTQPLIILGANARNLIFRKLDFAVRLFLGHLVAPFQRLGFAGVYSTDAPIIPQNRLCCT
jgi:hypothetical protein